MPGDGEGRKTGIHVDLESFLKRLSADAAAEARAAAGRMDELERAAQEFEGIERRYAPWALGAALLFVVAAVIVLTDAVDFRQARSIFGFVGLAAMAAALPAVAISYALHVRRRTRADRDKLELNRKHFLPHGGLYFPPAGRGAGAVYLTEPQAPGASRQSVDDIRAGRIW